MSADKPGRPEPAEPQPVVTHAGPSSGAGPTIVGAATDRYSNLPAIEIELVHEVRRPPTVDRPWAMAEVWTQNRVYHIDTNMVCIEVTEIGTNKPVTDHGLIGARLLGGQHNDAQNTYLSHPFPRPGTEAVFEQSRKNDVMFSHSSTVTRVVLRLRQISIVNGGERFTWDQIAGSGRKTNIPDND